MSFSLTRRTKCLPLTVNNGYIYDKILLFKLTLHFILQELGRMPDVHGELIDNESRCVHWHSPLDVIALKFKCCQRFYACYSCHDKLAGHPPQRYNLRHDSNEKLVLCGVCRTQLTFEQYVELRCPRCAAHFNPGCKIHYDLYFEMPE